MKRIALLIAALLIAALPALADEQLDADRRLVEALFAAAAGTTADAEKTARADMTDEETAARTQALADYRRLSEVWLTAVLAPDPEPDTTPAPTATPAPEETPAPHARRGVSRAFGKRNWPRLSEFALGAGRGGLP